MATITTAVYLEDAARTAGEAWTINGGTLTIRTDSRWHANSPASMTGSLAGVTISSSLGGQYKIDGTTVRWIPFDSGTGNVPAIGTSITQGAVSGYLLGVWASITSAPTAVAAAMPASGFIKFREVTGGTFTSGALSGIGASATGPDVVGWIEVVHDQAIAITVPRLGKFEVRGAWFDLGITTGSANQIVQLPTNGSTTTYVPGLWIANTDTPTTDDDYDFYPSIYAAAMIAANLGTDIRSKFVSMETNGSCRIGHNGTTNIGYVPPAGRKIRIPNVFGRQCATGTRATNAIPNATAGTRPDFTTTSAGYIDIEYFNTDWYLLFAQPYYVKMNHVGTFDYINISECATALDIYDGGNGMSQTLDARTVTLTSNFAGGRIEKWDCPRHAAGTTDHAFEVLNCIGQTIKNCRSGVITYARSTGMAYQFNQCYNITLENCSQFNANTVFTTCYDSIVRNHNHVDRYVGTTNTTTGIYVISILAASNNILVDGVVFGFNNTIVNNHPYAGVINIGQSKNIKFRNFGSRSAILNGGSANIIGYIYVSGGNNQNIQGQRCYVIPTRTGSISTTNSDKNVLYEHIYGDFADTLTIADLNTKFKGGSGTNTTTGQGSVYGTHFFDVFTSDTVGRVVLAFNEPTTETSYLVTTVAGTPQFTSAGNLVLNDVGDEVIIEMSYFALGHTGLSATAPTITGTNVSYSANARWGNHDIYYQIDTGSGWNGTWKNFTGANLNSESISASTGFKLKMRFVCAVASTTNLLTYISLLTTSTLSAQTDNLYPLDVSTVTLTGLQPGSEVRCYSGLDPATSILLDGVESSGTSFVLTHSLSSTAGYIQIFALGYQPIRLEVTYTSTNVSIPIQQVIDRVYINN
mgnify:CR=1 FL=1